MRSSCLPSFHRSISDYFVNRYLTNRVEQDHNIQSDRAAYQTLIHIESDPVITIVLVELSDCRWPIPHKRPIRNSVHFPPGIILVRNANYMFFVHLNSIIIKSLYFPTPKNRMFLGLHTPIFALRSVSNSCRARQVPDIPHKIQSQR